MTGMNREPIANQGLTYWFFTSDSCRQPKGCIPRRSVAVKDDQSAADVTLPAADELNREGSGLAVIGGLTPEVVGVGDFPLDLRGFRILAVVDRGIGHRWDHQDTSAWFGSPIEAGHGPVAHELLGEPDLGQAGGGRAGHLQRAVFRRLSIRIRRTWTSTGRTAVRRWAS